MLLLQSKMLVWREKIKKATWQDLMNMKIMLNEMQIAIIEEMTKKI